MDGMDNCSRPTNVEVAYEPRIGIEFDTIEDAWQFWIEYERRSGFDVRKQWYNINKRTGNISSMRFVCNKEGLRKQDKRDCLTKCPRAETRTNCLSRMGIIQDKQTKKYKVHDVVLEHNHVFHTPETVHMMSSQRRISDVQATEMDLADDSGIKMKASYELISRHGGGKENVGFTLTDQKNYLRRRRQRELKYGEAGSILRYFQQQSLDNPSFFHAIQLDDEEQITNMFWADARMIMDYSYFGDVVTFDTTYSTNNEFRPLGVFIGFNHHRSITIFGATLLYDETKESFEWLFRTFLEAHNQKKPMTIFTDQDQAMASALHNVMPGVHHGLCTWHIMQNAIKHVGNIVRDKCSLLKDFKKCMYQYENEKTFEEAWVMILDYYGVKENTWLKGIFGKKEKWARCYMNEVYTLGMRSTQLSESLNGDLKDYLKSDLDIVQFFKNFERVIEDKRYNELQAEFESRKKLPRVRMLKSPLLQQVAQKYTPSVFDLFQDEFDWSLSAIIKDFKEHHPIHTYIVGMFNRDKEYILEKFETVGILCSHALKVLDVIGIKLLPEQYILKRWSRDAKNGSVQDARGKEVQVCSNLSATQRYRSLCSRLVALACKSSESEEMYEFVGRAIDELSKQIENMCATQNNKANGDDLQAGGSFSKGKDNTDNDVPLVNVKGLKKRVGQKGRKRLKSWVEKVPKRKKMSNKDKTNSSEFNGRNEFDSIAHVLFEKYKGFLNCHHGVLKNNRSSYYPTVSTMEFDQAMENIYQLPNQIQDNLE